MGGSKRRDWADSNRKKIERRARSVQRQENAPGGATSHEQQHARARENQLNSFTGGHQGQPYERVVDLKQQRGANLTGDMVTAEGLGIEALIDLARKQGGVIGLAHQEDRDALYQLGGEALRHTWPLYDLLCMLPATDKADALRQAVVDSKEKEYVVVLEPSEYNHLQSELANLRDSKGVK